MPKRMAIYSALLSSPGGLDEDRRAVKTAVAEANQYLKGDDIQVDVLDWEVDVRPTVGADGQDVVNTQICNTADLALVLVHDRIGTPTPRAVSGTVEEAEIILARRDAGENVDLMVFFRKPAIRLSADTIRQLQQVLDFRTAMEGRGVFWKEYENSADLGRLVRLYLPGSVRALSGRQDNEQVSTSRVAAGTSRADGRDELADAELGSIDLEIKFTDSVAQMNSSLNVMTSATADVAAGMEVGTANLERLNVGVHRDPKEIRRTINRVVDHLEKHNEVVEAELPLIESAMSDATDSLIGMISLSYSEIQGGMDDFVNLKSVISGNIDTVNGTVSSIVGYRNSMSELPRMTKELNVSRRRGVELLDRMIFALRKYLEELNDVSSLIDGRIAQFGD